MTVDYNSVNRQLISAGTGVWASESHGFLCGVFCASNTVVSTMWQEYLLVGVENPSDLPLVTHKSKSFSRFTQKINKKLYLPLEYNKQNPALGA